MNILRLKNFSSRLDVKLVKSGFQNNYTAVNDFMHIHDENLLLQTNMGV